MGETLDLIDAGLTAPLPLLKKLSHTLEDSWSKKNHRFLKERLIREPRLDLHLGAGPIIWIYNIFFSSKPKTSTLEEFKKTR